MMRFCFIVISLLFSTTAFSAGVLNDSDIPALREALQKSYTPELCHNDLPNASTETCQCLGKAMADNLNAAKLKLCQKDGYDACVAAEFTAAKSNLTEKQINDCKALTKETAQPTAKPASDASEETTPDEAKGESD